MTEDVSDSVSIVIVVSFFPLSEQRGGTYSLGIRNGTFELQTKVGIVPVGGSNQNFYQT